MKPAAAQVSWALATQLAGGMVILTGCAAHPHICLSVTLLFQLVWKLHNSTAEAVL